MFFHVLSVSPCFPCFCHVSPCQCLSPTSKNWRTARPPFPLGLACTAAWVEALPLWECLPLSELLQLFRLFETSWRCTLYIYEEVKPWEHILSLVKSFLCLVVYPVKQHLGGTGEKPYHLRLTLWQAAAVEWRNVPSSRDLPWCQRAQRALWKPSRSTMIVFESERPLSCLMSS